MTSPTPTVDTQAVLWWRLIAEMEEFRRVRHWGLAGVWSHVRRGEYAAARDRFDSLREDLQAVDQ